MTNVRIISTHLNTEVASTDVRDAVAALRWLGHKTVSGMHRIVGHCGTTPRRIRTLFHRDQVIAVSAEERRSIALSIAELFDAIATECEAHADKCRAKAETIRLRERDHLNSLGGDVWPGSTTSQRRHAA